MLACAAENREMIRHECDLYLSCHILLDAVHHGLHVAAYRIKVHSLMHLLAIPVCNLVLPIKLPLCKSVLLEKMMRLYEDERCSSLKTYAALDTDDSVTDVDVTSDTERTCNVTDSLDNLYRIHLDSVE